MALARTIIQDALTEIGAYSTGEGISAADSAVALRRFQMMVDAWNADELALAVNRQETFTLTGGTSTVTIGETLPVDVEAPRPTYFTAVNWIVPGSSPAVEAPIGPMDDDQYAQLSIKNLQSAPAPQLYYFNATTPNGELFFWPTPSSSVSIVLYYPQPMTSPVSLTTDMIGPAGYQEAFMYQLAMRLVTPFGRQMPPALPEMASAAYARMKRPNTQPGLLGVDAALTPSAGGYNIITNSYSGGSMS